MKIVINTCYGGFGLSDAAMHRIAELKGLTVYPGRGSFGTSTFWLVPEGERENQDNFHRWTMDERAASNARYSKQVLNVRDIDRNDPAMVQAVEELGAKANGYCAELKVVEIPDGTDWQLEEYDGMEHIAEVRRTWR